ncbi:MAG: xanthine dehydrogenase family protein molybdopterin-binding subunit [Candidatus Rokubacteria bacterium]|nr:xanthine dehydrogenase family protein molybdopterin-binding subunit [Candidatus Rokubacteria bacterium]
MATRTMRVVGQPLPRFDTPGKVTGTAVYAADVALPGMLVGKVLRSTAPHARIARLDLGRAARLPGVRAVIGAADVPDVRYGGAVKDETVFARETVRYVGQPVAAVAATTPEAADAALAAIEVVYAPLPTVLDLDAALAPGAPLVHEEWERYTAIPILHRDGNVCNRARIVAGDVERGFEEADRIFAHRFRTSMVHQGYTEPRVAVAQWDSSGTVTVWSNTQLPFEVQNTLAEILAMPPGQIRVVVPGIGGGFGGKLRVGMEHFAALLARKAGRPVRMITTGEEELTAAYPRQAAVVELKTGVRRDGRITAKAGRIWLDTGAFAGSGPGVASVATLVLAGPYRIPNLHLEGFAVYTNKTNCGSFRAPSGPQANFAVESQMDMIADALGLDPLDIRLRNIVREGDEGPTGQVLRGVGLEECLRRAAAAIGWSERRPGPGRGKGLACGWWTTTGGSSGVYVKLNPDGTVVLNTGAAEIGTGALTGAAQVLAEELGVDLADIRVVSADTFSTPFDFGAQGSRTAFAVGNACRAAVADLKPRLFALAAGQLGVEPEACALADKQVVADGKRLSLAELARLSQQTGGGLIAQGTFIAPPTPFDAKRVEGHVYPAFHSPSFHAHAVDLSVDAETAEVAIHRYVVAQDVGFAMNPTSIEGQIEGGVAQGLGQALSEEIVYEEGRVLNPNLTDYKMPTARDIPRVETILVEHPSSAGPYGAKGVGEPPNIEPPAAVANAVAVATGLRVTTLPITAEKIALGLRDAAGRGELRPWP